MITNQPPPPPAMMPFNGAASFPQPTLVATTNGVPPPPPAPASSAAPTSGIPPPPQPPSATASVVSSSPAASSGIPPPPPPAPAAQKTTPTTATPGTPGITAQQSPLVASNAGGAPPPPTAASASPVLNSTPGVPTSMTPQMTPQHPPATAITSATGEQSAPAPGSAAAAAAATVHVVKMKCKNCDMDNWFELPKNLKPEECDLLCGHCMKPPFRPADDEQANDSQEDTADEYGPDGMPKRRRSKRRSAQAAVQRVCRALADDSEASSMDSWADRDGDERGGGGGGGRPAHRGEGGRDEYGDYPQRRRAPHGGHHSASRHHSGHHGAREHGRHRDGDSYDEARSMDWDDQPEDDTTPLDVKPNGEISPGRRAAMLNPAGANVAQVPGFEFFRYYESQGVGSMIRCWKAAGSPSTRTYYDCRCGKRKPYPDVWTMKKHVRSVHRMRFEDSDESPEKRQKLKKPGRQPDSDTEAGDGGDNMSDEEDDDDDDLFASDLDGILQTDDETENGENGDANGTDPTDASNQPEIDEHGNKKWTNIQVLREMKNKHLKNDELSVDIVMREFNCDEERASKLYDKFQKHLKRRNRLDRGRDYIGDDLSKRMNRPKKRSHKLDEIRPKTPFQCRECGNYFTVKFSLHRHLATVHHGKPRRDKRKRKRPSSGYGGPNSPMGYTRSHVMPRSAPIRRYGPGPGLELKDDPDRRYHREPQDDAKLDHHGHHGHGHHHGAGGMHHGGHHDHHHGGGGHGGSMADDHDLVADDVAIRETDALFSTPSSVGQHQQNHVSQSSNHHATDEEARRAEEERAQQASDAAAAFAANATVDQQQPPFAGEQHEQEAVADTPMSDTDMQNANEVGGGTSASADSEPGVKQEENPVAFAGSASDVVSAASPTADTSASAASATVSSSMADDVAAAAPSSLIDATAMDESDDEDVELKCSKCNVEPTTQRCTGAFYLESAEEFTSNGSSEVHFCLACCQELGVADRCMIHAGQSPVPKLEAAPKAEGSDAAADPTAVASADEASKAERHPQSDESASTSAATSSSDVTAVDVEDPAAAVVVDAEGDAAMTDVAPEPSVDSGTASMPAIDSVTPTNERGEEAGAAAAVADSAAASRSSPTAPAAGDADAADAPSTSSGDTPMTDVTPTTESSPQSSNLGGGEPSATEHSNNLGEGEPSATEQSNNLGEGEPSATEQSGNLGEGEPSATEHASVSA